MFGWQGYREGYFFSVTLLAMGLDFCAMFAFLVPAGSYFGLVRFPGRPSVPTPGARRECRWVRRRRSSPRFPQFAVVGHREHPRCRWPVPVCRPDGWRGPSGFPGGCGARDGPSLARSASPAFVSPTARHLVCGRRRPRRR